MKKNIGSFEPGYITVSIPGLLILLILTAGRVSAQERISSPVRLMFYNVENLFDVYNDSLKEDDDFLPAGPMRWNYTRYDKKINSLYKTIIAAGEWSPPEIVAFCEVEKRKALEDLVYGTFMSKYDYRIIHDESPDRRGIDVCMVYRKDCINVIDYEYWIPSGEDTEVFSTRSILYTRFLYGTDTIHLIVNHWPSRRGGVLAGEEIRMRIASMVREKADSINKEAAGGAKIIIMGDFNCTPDDGVMRSLTAPSESGSLLVNLSEKQAGEGIGTYRYRGTWEMIDQVIASKKLLSCKSGLWTDPGQMSVFSPGFLLVKDPKYPGFTPFSTYLGYRYQGGFSDHLPVLLTLKLKSQD